MASADELLGPESEDGAGLERVDDLADAGDDEGFDEPGEPAGDASLAAGPGDALVDEGGLRLDRWLADRLALPRNQVERWIEEGRVLVDGKSGRAGVKLRAGQRIGWTPPAPADPGAVPEDGPLTLLHEDADLLAIDKPAGVAVHPGAGRSSGTLANFLLARYPELARIGGPGRPGIVHRLDQGTTGVLLVARSPAAYQALVRAFAERAIEKTYVALVYGRPRELRGTLDQPIGRHPQDRQRMAIRPGGRPARTHYRVVASDPHVALLEVGLETGRTHQIRVHAQALGHPLVGDPVYGGARWKSAPRHLQKALALFPRPALHARRLELAHPVSGAPLRIESPFPGDLLDLWSAIHPAPWPSGL